MANGVNSMYQARWSLEVYIKITIGRDSGCGMTKMEIILIPRFIKMICWLFWMMGCSQTHETHNEYYPNGQLKVSGEYENGNAHGYWQGYYPNGQMKSAGEYVNGELSGEWAWYYADGSIVKDTIYTILTLQHNWNQKKLNYSILNFTSSI